MHNLTAWIGLFTAIAALMLGSRKHMGLSFLTGAVILGIATMDPSEIISTVSNTIKDPSVIILTAAISMIPIIAGMLEESGRLKHLIENLRLKKQAFLGFSPALIGLLPIPGGALFSAPVVNEAGGDLDNKVKSGINIWFRHILYFIYPLSPALIIPAEIANLSVYSIIVYQLPFFLLTGAIGYLYLLRRVEGQRSFEGDFSAEKLIPPLAVILIAPLLDFTLQKSFSFEIGEISTLLAILCSFLLMLLITKSRKSVLKKSITEMEPWNFALMMIGIFVFINIFKASGIGSLIASLSPPKLVLSIVFGFLLGLATGRINLPASIIIPIMLTTYGFDSLPLLLFSLTYFSIFLGYVTTPVHPCVGVTLEYFDTDMGDFLKLMIIPVALGLGIAVIFFIAFL